MFKCQCVAGVNKTFNPKYYFEQIHEIRWWALLFGAFSLLVFFYLDTLRFTGDSLNQAIFARIFYQLLPLLLFIMVTRQQKARKVSNKKVYLLSAAVIVLVGIGHAEIIQIAHANGFSFPRIGLTIVLIYAGILLVMPILHSIISSLLIIVIASYAYQKTGMLSDEIISISVFYLLFAGCCVFMNHVCTRILMANSKLVKRINDQANTDNLTGLSNRRHFFDWADQVYKQSNREAKAFAVLLVDLDQFKQVNDSLGHKTGDHVLIKVADILRALCRRPLDLTARFGGDEFVVLLYETNEAHIKTVCTTIIAEIEAINATLIKKIPQLRFGVSIGVAVNDGQERFGIKTLIEMADQSLYEVKRNGKNDYSLAGKGSLLRSGNTNDFLNLA